ncbi:glycosyltransferase [Shewanella fodinae]|uniref:Glycosyltransferase involved in cell wall biosynthesis n=1 Tax=Shewanella fodinae TaxID=552357 RepID=A0A4R2F719_9GAMM|nr:glycosyltransferase [Shewanella fodinae]TCN77395.1 glycosyltransferase involved in cell wall biosynthesis [Shewanella fodinae]
MKTILISAYALSPTKGSEYNVGWEFVTRLSKHYRVIVCYGASGDFIGDTAEIDDYFLKNIHNNILPVKIPPSKISLFFNFFNKIGLNYFFYFSFYFWQLNLYKKVVELLKVEHVDIIHQLNPIGFREPGFLWKLNSKCKIVWGPIGGGNFINFALLKNQRFTVKSVFLLKNIFNYIQIKFSKRVGLAFRNSDVVIFCNSENMSTFSNRISGKSYIISEQGISSKILDRDSILKEKAKKSRGLNLLFVGSLYHRKNLKFLLDVLIMLKNSIPFHLEVVGDGHLREELTKYAINNHINEFICWKGNISRNEVLASFNNADLHCICSLSEANTTVVYEAFSCLTPTIAFNINGFSDTLSNGRGFLVNISSYENTVIEYSQMLMSIFNNPDKLIMVKNSIKRDFHLLSWENKIFDVINIYEDLMTTVNEKSK